MPRLLQRYILLEFLRVFLITAGILVTVIAFGAAIKPLSNDSLISATQAMKYIFLAMVPMLQFALPFAAGFATTMTLHRLATDNEIIAAAVSGISYRRLLLPLIVAGVMLGIVMVVLTQWIIPRFWAQMEKTITADMAALFEATIGRGSAFELGDIQIYADDMEIDTEPEGTAADIRILLGQLAAVKTDGDGRATLDVTARNAAIDVFQQPSGTQLRLVLLDVVAYDAEKGTFTAMPVNRPEQPITVPGVFKDEPMAKTRGQLLEYLDEPTLHYHVDRARNDLARRMTDVERRAAVHQALREHGRVEFTAPDDGGEPLRYEIRADGLKRSRLIREDGQPVEVWRRRGAAVGRRMVADEAWLTRAGGTGLRAGAFDLSLIGLEVTDESDTTNRRARLDAPGIMLPGEATDWHTTELPLLRQKAEQMVSEHDAEAELRAAIIELDEEEDEIRDEVHSRLAKRYAISATAPLLLLLGALLAMLLRRAQPLTIYLLAFLPSILDLILISGGEQMMRDGKPEGIIILWSGNAILVLGCLITYWKLSRH